MITKLEATILAKSFFTDGFEDILMSDLFSVLELADDLYYNDEESFLTDTEYDSLYQYGKSIDPTNEYFLGIGSAVRGGKVNLPFQMGSLDQVYTGEIAAWVIKHNLHNEVALVSDKLDGASGMVIYDGDGKFQIAYSRGDGVQGADISRHLSLMPSVPKQIGYDKPIVIRGENIISKTNFPLVQKVATSRSGRPYKNARNMVSGLMNASTNPPNVYRYVDFVAYEIVGSELRKSDQLQLLDKLGFKVVEYLPADFAKLNDSFLTAVLTEAKRNSDYELDGIVIDVNSAEKRADMNPTKSTLNPAYSIKYKVTDESNIAYPTVVDVEINISKDGYLKPRVQIEPVDLVGVTVTWATGFNMKFINTHKIGPGSKIKITRSGDVIPFIMEVIHPAEVEDYKEWFKNKIDEHGDTVWTDTGVDLVLKDPESNPTVRYEKLVDFFDTLNVPNLGEGNLQKIFDLGFETPDLIIELTQEDLSTIIGSKSIGTKIFKGIREKLTNIPIYKLMGAHPSFGRGVGVRKMKKLYEAFQGDMSKCSSLNWIVSVDGFEEKTARKIQAGYEEFMCFLGNISPYISIQEYEAPKQGTLSGKVFVFTGFRDANLEKAIENVGGKMGSSVSSKTHYVVTTDPTGSSGKLDKARSLGIPVIGVDELKGML